MRPYRAIGKKRRDLAISASCSQHRAATYIKAHPQRNTGTWEDAEQHQCLFLVPCVLSLGAHQGFFF